MAVVVLVARPWLPEWFSHDATVQSLIGASLLVVAVQQPLAGPVFALDGILIGAGDGRWLALAGTVMFAAFLPAAWLVLSRDLGVVGVWWALTWFMVVRGVLLWRRSRSNAWLVVGDGRTPALSG
jgi:Na+-driven multidrug efflux pump